VVNAAKKILSVVIVCFAGMSSAHALDCPALIIRLQERMENPEKFYPEDQIEEKRSKIERTLARVQALSERSWWADQISLETNQQLVRAIKDGKVFFAEERPGIGISGEMNLPFTTTALDRGMDFVRDRFFERLNAKGLSTEQTKIVITSIIRTEELQRMFIAQGLPAARRSSHTYGIAFDISFAWFEDSAPEYAVVLKETLQSLQEEGKINLIREDLQRVWHVALSPDFYRSLQN